MRTPATVAVVVLAGGGSRRFGSDKLVADLGGQTVLARTLASVARAVPDAPVVVVGPARRSAQVGAGVDVVAEDPPGGGPAAGVAAGARHLAARPDAPGVVAVVAGDAPWSGAALPALVAGLEGSAADAAVATGPDGRRQHLLLVVRAAALATSTAGQDLHGAPARLLLADLEVTEVDVDPHAVLDVDDPAALERARGIVVGP